MIFYFHWDSKVWAITIAILLFSLLLFLTVFLKRLHIIVRIVCPLSIFCFLPALLNMPLHMNLSENAFSSRMLSFSIDIPYQQIDKTYGISRDDISGSIRTHASGGLFGYSGNFKNEKLGHYSMYAISVIYPTFLFFTSTFKLTYQLVLEDYFLLFYTQICHLSVLGICKTCNLSVLENYKTCHLSVLGMCIFCHLSVLYQK